MFGHLKNKELSLRDFYLVKTKNIKEIYPFEIPD